ncbi:MAG: peptide chain release factor 1 [Acetobacteraceae bacterium]
MSEHEYASKREKLERLLNDPTTPTEPARVWSLLAEIERAGAEASDKLA